MQREKKKSQPDISDNLLEVLAVIKIAIIIIKVTKSSCNSWLLFLLGHRRAVMRLLQPEPLQLLGDSSDVGQILCLRVEESSEKKNVLILFTFKKKKKRNTGSCAMHRVRDVRREVFWLLQFHILVLFVVSST